MMHLRQELASGRLDLEIDTSVWPPDELFDLAERQNPKRAFLFVSKVLGRHIPVAPAVMRRAHRELARRLKLFPGTRPVFVGMAETAIALGAGVFRECLGRAPNALFLADTRHEFNRAALARFEEKHSHASAHTLYEPETPLGDLPLHLILVDDEMTTGRTFAQLAAAIGRRHPVSRLTRVVLTDWSGTANPQEPVISLLEGRWQWTAKKPPAAPHPLPSAPHEPAPVSPRQDWGRFGMTDPDCRPWPDMHEKAGRKVLVLGTSEFIWPPFLLAERFEREGALVLLGATTLSPIQEGAAIKNRFAHLGNYGLGCSNYLYNVDPREFDVIYLCCETARASVDAALLRHLGNPVVLEYGQ